MVDEHRTVPHGFDKIHNHEKNYQLHHPVVPFRKQEQSFQVTPSYSLPVRSKRSHHVDPYYNHEEDIAYQMVSYESMENDPEELEHEHLEPKNRSRRRLSVPRVRTVKDLCLRSD